MKKLGRKGTVHPSSAPSAIISYHLSTLLPTAILTLTAALSPQDKEVLAYLISSSNNPQKYSSTTHEQHRSSFNCDCFRCYMNYWIRWDDSPNRQLIHEIIDAFELHAASLGLLQPKKKKKNKKDHNQLAGFAHGHELNKRSLVKPVQEISSSRDCGEQVAAAAARGSLRRFVAFFAERIWGTLRTF